MHFSWIIRVNRPHLFENLHIVCFEIHSFGTRALFQQFRTVLCVHRTRGDSSLCSQERVPQCYIR